MSTVPSSPALPAKPRKKRVFLKFIVSIVLVGMTLLIPPVFRGVVWLLLEEEALRQGASLSIGQLDGSAWEPLIVRSVHFETARALGGLLKVGATSAEVVFKWENLLTRSVGGRFMESLTLKGVTVHWTPLADSSKSRAFFPSWSFGGLIPVPLPAKMRFGISRWQTESDELSLKLEDVDLEVSEFAAGDFKAPKVELKARGWEHTFRDVVGKTAIQGKLFQLGEMRLMEGALVESFAVNLESVGAGKIGLELSAQAFGGKLNASAQASPGSAEAPLEASGKFSKIGVAPLAAFLKVTEAAGGTLEEGKFSFRGSPSTPERGSATLRLEARNFQWESRQWDSLVVGATLMEHRIQVPEFSLQQGHNQLVINGDMQLPGGGVSWWKADFGMNVTARIDNLTELSALFLPEFKYAAGALTVDGAIRSQSGVLGGALIATGSKLKWRNAPIEELNAAVKLDGNDIRILNAELVNRADLIRAKGTVHVGDAWWYQGELRAAVGNLANYSDLLQPPLVSEPYAGEIHVDWNGQGAAQGHEGRISGRFEGLRPVKPRGNWPQPLLGDFWGKYGKGGLELESVSVGDEKVSARGKLTVRKEGGRVDEFQLKKGNQVAAEGGFSIPRKVWDAWPALDWNRLLSTGLPVDLQLHVDRLDLVDLGRFPSMPPGLKGEISGDWESHGGLQELKGKGALSVQKGAVMIGESVLSDLNMNLEWKGRVLEAKGLSWIAPSGRYEGTAELEWKEGQAGPLLNLQATCPNARWQEIGGLKFTVPGKHGVSDGTQSGVTALGHAEFKAVGPIKEPLVSGELLINTVDVGGAPDLRWFWTEQGKARKFLLNSAPSYLAKSKLKLRIASGEAVAVAGTVGSGKVELQVGGLCSKPEVSGEIRLSLRGSVLGETVEAEPVVLRFEAGNPDPQLEIRVKGVFEKAGFSASAVGPFSRPLREYTGEAPMTAEKVRTVFEDGKGW